MARLAKLSLPLAGVILIAMAPPGIGADGAAPAMDVPPGMLGVVDEVDAAKGTFRMEGREMTLPPGAREPAPGQTVRLINDTRDGRILELAPAGAPNGGGGVR